MARVGIIGSAGRMGRAVADLLSGLGHELAGGVDQGGNVAALAEQSDVLIDFSAPAALNANLAAARDALTPILVGTTGLSEGHHRLIGQAAQSIAVLQTGNTSLGVTLLAHLVRQAAEKLGPEWDIEIVEMHHRMKVDVPSGTALLLGEAAAQGRGVELAANTEMDRSGKRREGAIGFASLRGGTVAGEHSVTFAGEHERITVAHSAESRELFARGAVRAAQWLIGRAPNRYAMNDVLGL